MLTAAHCLDDAQGNSVGIRTVVNGYDTSPFDSPNIGQIARDIGQVRVHPGWGDLGFYVNDIALLKLQGSVSGIDPIQWNTANNTPPPDQGYPVKIMGLGATDPLGTQFPDNLLDVELPVLSCKYLNEAKQLCAGGREGEDSCTADSGGCLYDEATNKIVGIVSAGLSPCGKENSPAFYTRVSYYDQWLESSICELSGEYCPQSATPAPQQSAMQASQKLESQEGCDKIEARITFRRRKLRKNVRRLTGISVRGCTDLQRLPRKLRNTVCRRKKFSDASSVCPETCGLTSCTSNAA